METVRTNIDLILRRCQRQGVQPREMMLRAFGNREELEQRVGDMADSMIERVSALPDYDLSDPDSRAQAAAALEEMYGHVISQQFAHPDSAPAIAQQRDIESRQGWQSAGMFEYELGENHELVLHIPPMIESVKSQQLRDSLHELTAVVVSDPDIQEVRGSSLLLEHPVAQRLGFRIEETSDEGFTPNFRMSRDEFLKRFG